MNFSKVSPWLSRLIILAAAALFTMISVKFILDPHGSAAASGLSIASPVGSTNARAGFGGFPLGFALILVFCLFSSRRLLPALTSIVVVSAVILLVRLYGAQQDGTFSQSAHLLGPEVALLVLSLLGVLIERRRVGHGPRDGMLESLSS
jgi:glycerol uptake facilitator-like aquaporin